eukprot:TRINITY_DN2292_c1_g1_i5.p1 TRINITY_DN2292_c1_g1~~TRINITY_DN2292_c1_g1_i5.p1  ORF type:complete len:240 (+),score=27.57 TRINITY_DN2292_c1_g1_i5:106-825(+)
MDISVLDSVTGDRGTVVFEIGDTVDTLRDKIAQECRVSRFTLQMEGQPLTNGLISGITGCSEIEIHPPDKKLAEAELARNGFTPKEVRRAIACKRHDLLPYFTDMQEVDFHSLKYACDTGYAKGVRALLPVIKYNSTYTYQCLLGAVYNGSVDTVNVIVDYGVDVNHHKHFAQGAIGNAYHIACSWSTSSMVNALIEAGADTSCNHAHDICHIKKAKQTGCLVKLRLVEQHAVNCSISS